MRRPAAFALALLSAWLALPAAGQGIDWRMPSSAANGVTGPAAACDDNDLTRWDGATATVVQCSVPSLSDAGAITGLTGVGTTTVTASTSITNSAMTSGRVLYSSTAGIEADDADLTFDGTSLTATGALVGNGTLAAPGLAFSAATGTGLNRNVLGFGELGVGVTGIRQMTFFTTGVHVPNALPLWFGNSTSDTNVGLKWASTGVIKVTNGGSGGGDWQIGTGILTASTMTAEAVALSKTVTSSYTWTNAQVVALGASLTGDINVATLPAKTQLLDALVVITGAAAGPATVTVSCGDAVAGTPFINYVVASDAKAAANTVYGDAAAERGTSIDTEFYYLPSYTATTLVTCHFISTVANLNTVTGSTGRVILTTRLLP